MADLETKVSDWRAIMARVLGGEEAKPDNLPPNGWYERHVVKSTNGARLEYLYWRWREDGRRRGRCLGRIDL